MSIIEYLFERKNPGKVGSIQKNTEPIKMVSVLVLIFRILVSAAIVFGVFYVTVGSDLTIVNTVIITTILFVYCLISYCFIPRPDTSNMGLLGGLVDHPFKYTDDINRTLFGLSIIMYPGRFISKTVIQTFVILRNMLRKSPAADR